MPIPERIQVIRRNLNRPPEAPRPIQEDQQFLEQLALIGPPRLPEEIVHAVKVAGHQTLTFRRGDGWRGIALYQQFKGILADIPCNVGHELPFTLSGMLSGRYTVVHPASGIVTISLPPNETGYRVTKSTSARHWIILERAVLPASGTSNYILFYCGPQAA